MPKHLTTESLRRMAVAATFRPPASLGRAVRGLGFVQADPIRSPARAQDLILRHRAEDYRAGDLERRFGQLRLEEDFLYAYGMMPRDTWRLLHPRHDPDGDEGRHRPMGLAAEVLAFVRDRGATHPRDLEERFGRERAVNGWGGFSKATTRALQGLQYYGELRVLRRQDGIRVYAAAPPHDEPLPAAERTRRLVMLVASILAPLPERSLSGTCALLRRGAPDLEDPAEAVRALLASGELACGEVDGERFLWPIGLRAREAPREVRFLAPFDPLVWDRTRFELLWRWDYRFEAYTKAAQRRFGYYAMPLLWGDAVIGWACVTAVGGGVDVAAGFVGTRPKGAEFRRALDDEIGRFTTFLRPR